MKLLALVTDGFGAQGRIAQYNRDLVTALALSPAVGEVIVVPRHGREDEALPPKVRQCASAAGRVAWMRQAGAAAWSKLPDVIFCGHLYAVPFAAMLARVLRRPLWVQAHGLEAWTEPNAALRLSVEGAALVTAVSRHTRHRLLAWCGIAPERVRVLPNTVRAEFAARPRRASLARRFGLEGRRVVLTVGRLASAERYKGHDRVIRALAAVAAEHRDVAYLIVGDGDDRTRLGAVAAAEGVADRVVFAGEVANAELPDIYALADVFAMPSTGEGFGIVFLEAAASGVAVIGGNRDGSRDALVDGTIGTLVDPEDIAGIACAISDTLRGPPTTSPGAVRRFAFDNFAGHVDAIVREFARGEAHA